jgi:hypothetical protein
VVTAIGFAGGVALVGQATGHGGAGFGRVFLWSLVGCAIGAGAVYWIGPMLIVFGMFAAGTASIALREIVLVLRKGKR